WPGVLALLLVLGLGGVAGWQWREVDRLQGDLARLRDQAAQERADDRARLATLERRAAALEKQAGEVFNPQAVAAAVVPSVFRVRAGQVTGTAFVVARPGGGQGTHLLTNYHVVQEVWESGGRQVVLERRDQRFNARIVSANEANDVVHLSVAAEFPGLATTAEPVKSGQQIIVVGAPLGLEDTVTTGVVSAYRKIPDFPGTMIQFDASINPGNSGGPVINGAKQVVGIATAKQRDADGIGLAIPVKTACDLFDAC
ncbi:MAG TPA: S1C family serine protease, partial [Pilimelia sp.]|nr:S1C family serine protease [Pilimelia sp.]